MLVSWQRSMKCLWHRVIKLRALRLYKFNRTPDIIHRLQFDMNTVRGRIIRVMQFSLLYCSNVPPGRPS